MHWTDRRERYRAVLAGNECIHPGSVFDAISARIAEDLGFEVGMFAGSIGSFAVLGNPDLILLTLTEFAAQAYRINRAGKLPLMVDADHGYGNALNVMRTIQELETAGVAGIMIEDTSLPRGFREAKPTLISIEEGVGKMRAALSAREDKSLVIIGRTSAAAISGIDDAIARAKAYEAAGVDALFFAGGMNAGESGCDGGRGEASADVGRRRRAGSGVSCEAQRADRAAGPPTVLGGSEGGARHTEGVTRRCEAVGTARHCVGGVDEARDAGGGLQELDGEVLAVSGGVGNQDNLSP